mgnify:CR=1 FL=1
MCLSVVRSAADTLPLANPILVQVGDTQCSASIMMQQLGLTLSCHKKITLMEGGRSKMGRQKSMRSQVGERTDCQNKSELPIKNR